MAPGERRRSIVAAALPLLRSQGLQVSTAEIAQAAGVAEGTVFRVFVNKDELVQAVIDDVMDPAHTIDELLTIDAADPLPDRMAAIVRVLHARIADVSFLMGMLHSSGAEHRHPGHTRTQHEAHSARLRQSIAHVLAPDAHRLRESPEVTASLLRSIAFASAHPLLSDGGITDPHTLVNLFLHGLLQEDAEPTAPGGAAAASPTGNRPC